MPLLPPPPPYAFLPPPPPPSFLKNPSYQPPAPVNTMQKDTKDLNINRNSPVPPPHPPPSHTRLHSSSRISVKSNLIFNYF